MIYKSYRIYMIYMMYNCVDWDCSGLAHHRLTLLGNPYNGLRWPTMAMPFDEYICCRSLPPAFPQVIWMWI